VSLTDLLQLALIGLTVAAVPLSLVWLARGPRDARSRYVRLIAITLFITLDLILFGAFTRLTDSGLGCPDWPGCYGTASPLDALNHIRAAEAAQPSGPVTLAKAWIEMIHRYLAKGLGVLFIGIMLMAWIKRKALAQSPLLATLLFVGVCLQGAFGAWTVTWKLMPLIVTIHLLGANLLLAGTAWLKVRQEPALAVLQDRWLKPLAVFALLILFSQIALGGWVSTNYAALACMDFPLCQGLWWPPMDFAHGYTLWRDLGQTSSGAALPFAALTAVHWVHRNYAALVFIVLGLLAWRALRVPALRRLGTGIALALAWQLATGLSNIFFQWPLPVALAHNGGAAALVLLTALLLARLWQVAPTMPARSAGSADLLPTAPRAP
jgi:cytochrome c oxidase assembly protein subunit 15